MRIRRMEVAQEVEKFRIDGMARDGIEEFHEEKRKYFSLLFSEPEIRAYGRVLSHLSQ